MIDHAPYNAIAGIYDDIHRTPDAEAEDRETFAALDYRGGSVLDIGCGTGLFLDHVRPDLYVGVDPSLGMLQQLRRRHPDAFVFKTRFEEFETIGGYDLIVGLYGSPNYVEAGALRRIPKLLTPHGRYFLMFYRPGYTPVTYKRSGVTIPHHKHIPSEVMPGGRLTSAGNFIIVRGGAYEVRHVRDARALAAHSGDEAAVA